MKLCHKLEGDVALNVQIDGQTYKITKEGIEVNDETAKKILKVHGEVIQSKEDEEVKENG